MKENVLDEIQKPLLKPRETQLVYIRTYQIAGTLQTYQLYTLNRASKCYQLVYDKKSRLMPVKIRQDWYPYRFPMNASQKGTLDSIGNTKRNTQLVCKTQGNLALNYFLFFQHGVFFLLFFSIILFYFFFFWSPGTTPDATNWTLDFEPAFLSGPAPAIDFSNCSAVFPFKPRDFRFPEPTIPFSPLVSGFPV